MKKNIANALLAVAIVISIFSAWLSHVGLFTTSIILFAIVLVILLPVVWIWDNKEQKRRQHEKTHIVNH